MAFPSPTLNPKVFSTGDQCADNNSQGPHVINLNLSLLRRQWRLSWTSALAQKNPALIILPIHKRFLTLSGLLSVLFHYTSQGNICPDKQIRREKMVRKLRLWQLPLLLRETHCLQFQVSIWRKVQRAPMTSNIRITSGEQPNANVRIPIWGCSKKSQGERNSAVVFEIWQNFLMCSSYLSQDSTCSGEHARREKILNADSGNQITRSEIRFPHFRIPIRRKQRGDVWH